MLARSTTGERVAPRLAAPPRGRARSRGSARTGPRRPPWEVMRLHRLTGEVEQGDGVPVVLIVSSVGHKRAIQPQERVGRVGPVVDGEVPAHVANVDRYRTDRHGHPVDNPGQAAPRPERVLGARYQRRPGTVEATSRGELGRTSGGDRHNVQQEHGAPETEQCSARIAWGAGALPAVPFTPA